MNKPPAWLLRQPAGDPSERTRLCPFFDFFELSAERLGRRDKRVLSLTLPMSHSAGRYVEADCQYKVPDTENAHRAGSVLRTVRRYTFVSLKAARWIRAAFPFSYWAKYPLMSRIRCVRSVTKAITPPFNPAGTTAAFDMMLPSIAFRVDTTGCVIPVGHSVR